MDAFVPTRQSSLRTSERLRHREDGGDTIREFILHVDGSEARLRY